MTAQERLDYLLATVSTQTNKQVIVADIIEAVGMQSARVVLGTLQAAAAQDPVLAAAYQALVTVGISLSGDDRQSMLDQLAVAGSWSNEVRDAVKALGVVTQARWETLPGYATEPTLESVQAEIDAARLINAKALFCERMTTSEDAAAVWSQAWSDAAQ
jgi:hypothetical protein